VIIYQATKGDFLQHTLRDNNIRDLLTSHYFSATGKHVSDSEIQAWKHSLLQMAIVLNDEEIPDNAGVAIEYQLPRSNKRIDFILTGLDDEGQSKVVIVELKQWSDARLSEKEGIVWARRGGPRGESEGPHPCYQAWSYAALLSDFNEAVYEGGMTLLPCAYLHNYLRDGVIDHPLYQPFIDRAPLFLAEEQEKLRLFIKRHVRHGDKNGLIYQIEQGTIRPSKMLAENVLAMVQGKSEFVLIDDQKLVHETILFLAEQSIQGDKQVIIVQGGPGTGKSVVAINLLGVLIGKRRNARYVSKNAAPRAVYEAKLTGTFKKSQISNLFSGSGSFTEPKTDEFDVLVVDEAHRLNAKSGLYGNLGDNQIKELITSARCTVFFVDDDQCVTIKDIGRTEELRRWALELGAQVTEMELTSQFRCNGSDGYLAWLDDTLEIRETANQTLGPDEFDFRVLDSPAEVHALIDQKNHINNRARVVAGYCWEWASKNNRQAFDIVMPEHAYRRRWNLTEDGSLWIVAPESVEQVGCIHTCQGLELDYVGVIIGPDMAYVDDQIQTLPRRRARSDKSLSGLQIMMKANKASAEATADRIIKNTYRTLMTRGMRGCYVYCVDPALAAYLKSRLLAGKVEQSLEDIKPPTPRPATNVAPFRHVTPEERQQGIQAVRVLDLRFAAGQFSDAQAHEEGTEDWIELPDWVQSQPGLFVAQVTGESMNKSIPNGSWCLFRANPGGTRNGKIVVIQHHSIDDPETGGSYTIKRYMSEKEMKPDGSWRHLRVTLKPESDRVGFEPIVLELAEEWEFRVVAEFLVVLG